MPSAYIETTIPSYYVARSSMNIVQASRQASTQIWWDSDCSGFELYTSLEVIEEVEQGDIEKAKERLDLLKSVKRLELTEDVGKLAEKLIQKKLIPLKAASDAIHIAVACIHKMDYLVTWNFKHIANPFTQEQLSNVVREAGFRLPIMCNPEELIQYDEDN